MWRERAPRGRGRLKSEVLNSNPDILYPSNQTAHKRSTTCTADDEAHTPHPAHPAFSLQFMDTCPTVESHSVATNEKQPPVAAGVDSAVGRKRPGRPPSHTGCQVCGVGLAGMRLFHQVSSSCRRAPVTCPKGRLPLLYGKMLLPLLRLPCLCLTANHCPRALPLEQRAAMPGTSFNRHCRQRYRVSELLSGAAAASTRCSTDPPCSIERLQQF